MRYWIFVAAPQRGENGEVSAREIFERRIRDGFWGLNERTANRRNLEKGDRVVFYVARPESAFAGEALLASASVELDPSERERLAHGDQEFSAEHVVYLDDIEDWNLTRPVADLAEDLHFIEDASQWWVYLQGGIREISEGDYRRIRSGAPEPDDDPGIEREKLFALESHLEEFIDSNWTRIDWGRDLRIYKDDDQRGRQFPAGTWSIDFLAVDNRTNDLVVIELKRGQTSDATVGQILRYMNWVKENLARDGQKVRGVIVANEVDDALRYAARGLPDVRLLTYSVSFSLESFDE